MRAGAAGLRASGLRCNLRSRAALPPCRPRSVGRGGSAPSAPRSTRDVGQRPPPICESDRHTIISAEAREISREARLAASEARVADLAPVIAELQAAGVTSLGGLARGLTERGIPTARGGPKWTPVQVSRVLARLHV